MDILSSSRSFPSNLTTFIRPAIRPTLRPMNLLAAAAAVMALGTSSAHAQLWLSAAVQYNADGSGSSISEPAEFDNIVGTGNSEFSINGTPRGTTFALGLGNTTFSFTRPGDYNALAFYFDTTADPFARPFGAMPDLVVYGLGGMPLTPAPGADVQTNGQFSGTLPWGGQSSFTSGDWTVTVTEFNLGTNESSFVLSVVEVPTPGATALLGLGGLVLTRRRRA